MSKKSDKGSGVSLSPEFGEIVRRLKDKEPELDEIVNRGEPKAAMQNKKVEKMAERSKEDRLKLRALVEEGLPENEALGKVFPKDRNRTSKLGRWTAAGLWPVPESELMEASAQEAEPGKVETEGEPKQETGLESSVNIVTQCIDNEAELLEKIRAMLDTIEPAERPVGATAKGRYSPLKTKLVALRLPVTLNDELGALGGLKSRHIEKALMLYLKAMKGVKRNEG
jgi:hypothetical protein